MICQTLERNVCQHKEGWAPAGVSAGHLSYVHSCLKTAFRNEEGIGAHGGRAKGIPRNWSDFPFRRPMKTPSSRRTSGAAGGAFVASETSQTASESIWKLLSCNANCCIGEAAADSVRTANMARIARSRSIAGKWLGTRWTP
jgi:hypothetical protein